MSGAADAATMGAMLAILMKLYPGRTGKIVAWTGTASGLGHMAGKITLNTRVFQLFWLDKV